MADGTLRGRQRRYRGSGSIEDEVSLLQSRMRSGSLPEGSLFAAAYAGYEPARRCCPEAPAPSEDFVTWAEVLTGFGRQVFVRAGLAACRVRDQNPSRFERAALGAAEAWAVCPCEAHAAAAHAAVRAHRSSQPAVSVALAAAVESLSSAAAHAVWAIAPHGRMIETSWGPLQASGQEAGPATVKLVKAAIQREIGRWLLESAWVGVEEPPRLAADVTREHRRAVAEGRHEWLLDRPDAERRQALRLVLGRLTQLDPVGAEGWGPLERLGHLASKLIRSVDRWSEGELAELLSALVVEERSALPFEDLFRAVVAVAKRGDVSPALADALRLHLVRLPRGGWLGPAKPGVIRRVGRLLEEP